MSIKDITDDLNVWERGLDTKLTKLTLLAKVRPTRINGSDQVFISVKGEFGGQYVERTFLFPFPPLKMETLEESVKAQLQMLNGYLDAIADILEDECGPSSA